MSRRTGESQGLTLIETLFALFVFSIITVGLAPLLASSLKGATESRAATVGKNAAVDAMERVRGLPFFVSYNTQQKQVDVLDLYFPCAKVPYATSSSCPSNGTYDNTNYKFVTTCTGPSTNPACPQNLPSGYSAIFCAQFVSAKTNGLPLNSSPTSCAPPTVQNDYPATQPPVNTYAWNNTSSTNADVPPTQLMQLSVVVEWRKRGSTVTCAAVPAPVGCRSIQLATLVGTRKFGTVKLLGDSRLDYLIQVNTKFRDAGSPNGSLTSTLNAILGGAESQTEQRLLSSASQSLSAADIALTDDVPPTGGSAVVLATAKGAKSTTSAPPASTPAAVTAPPASVCHSYLGIPKDVAGVGTSSSQAAPNNVAVDVGTEIPSAQGGFVMTDNATYRGTTGGGCSASGTNQNTSFFVDNQAVTAGTYQLDPTLPMLATRKKNGQTPQGFTSSKATALKTSGRGLFSSATASFGTLRILPVDFPPYLAYGPEGPSCCSGGSTPYNNAVFSVEDFSASVNCNATGPPNAASTNVGPAYPAAGSTGWSATIKFWSDPSNDGSTVSANAGMQTLTLTGTTGGVVVNGSINTLGTGGVGSQTLTFTNESFTTSIVRLKAANPLVYDSAINTNDVYLFNLAPALNGYLGDFSAAGVTAGIATLKATARIDGAMHIVTTPTDPTVAESGLDISIGKLSCESFDAR